MLSVVIRMAYSFTFVYISKGLVTRGYIHFVFIILVLESMLLQVVQVVLLLVVLLSFSFGDAVMYYGALIWFKYMRMILDAVDKKALQDQVSFGLTLVVHMACSGCLMFVG